MFKFESNQSYIMPGHFGPRPIGNGSLYYHDVTTMIVTYLTERDKLAAYLPEPFEVGEQPTVSVFYVMNHEVDWLAGRSYNIVGVNASAIFRGEVDQLTGSYIFAWWENLTDAILLGREILGVPKIYADIPIHRIIDGEWQASAGNFGNKFVDISLKNIIPVTEEQLEQGVKDMEGKSHIMGWKYIPDISGMGSEISYPVLFSNDSDVSEAWVGQGEVQWNHLTWEQNPTQCHIVNAIADLPIIEYLPALIIKSKDNLAVPDRPHRRLR